MPKPSKAEQLVQDAMHYVRAAELAAACAAPTLPALKCAERALVLLMVDLGMVSAADAREYGDEHKAIGLMTEQEWSKYLAQLSATGPVPK